MKRLIIYVTSTLLLAADKILPVVAIGNGRFQQPLRYHANEESEENTIIGDVRKDYNKRTAEINKNIADRNQQQSSFTFAFLKSSNQKFFKIDKMTGIVKMTSMRMDREAICSSNDTCTIETDVIIYSHSNPQSMLRLIIEVLDINDNKPIFPFSSISETVSEASERGEIVILRAATDKDSSKFGVVRYFLRDDFDDLFKVVLVEGGFKKEPQVTIHLKGTLDRESKDFYALELIASDGGVPANTGSMFIDLIVSDENDNFPVFQNLPYYVEIPENTIVSHFFKVQAEDKDLNLNGKVEYHLSKESAFRYKEYFNINEMTGSLQLLRPLDYETFDIAVLTIIANDLGTYRHSSTTSFTVSVIDMNDNVPEIDIIDTNKPTEMHDAGRRLVTVEENSSPGSLVASMHVIDLDSGMGAVVQCFVDSKGDDFFEVMKISSNDFNLVTSSFSNLDRETKDRHPIIITCKDSDVNNPLSSSIDIVIDIIDVNDNPPFIPGCPKVFHIEEGNEVGHQIGIITAYDIDENENNTIEYSLKKTNTDIFHIHPKDGVLIALESLDREAKDKYDLELVVTDEGHLTSTCIVILKVTDVEDCDPEFEQIKYFFKIHGEHFNPLHPIGQVRALDRDLPPANLISYNIVSEFEYLDWHQNDTSESDTITNLTKSDMKSIETTAGENVFDIKSTSGLIYTARPLRRSPANRSHFILVVTATSGINKMASTTAEIHIDISQGRNRNRAVSSQLQDNEMLNGNYLSRDKKSEIGLEEGNQSENGMHYLKIPLLLGLTCVLVGLTVFVAIIIMQAICSKLSRAPNNLFSNDKQSRPSQHNNQPTDCNGFNKTPQLGSNLRLNLSKVLNLTQNIVKPIFQRNKVDQTPDELFVDEINPNSLKSCDERQNYLLESLVTSTSSASSQSLQYSPRHASTYKPSLDLRTDFNDAYRTSTLPANKDRRSSGYCSPTRSTFSSNDDNGAMVRRGSRRSADSGKPENRKLSIDSNRQYEIDNQPAEHASIFRLFDSQRSSTFHGKSKVHGRSSTNGNEDQRFDMDLSSNQKLGRFLWYHDV